jgi:hypothetical protein
LISAFFLIIFLVTEVVGCDRRNLAKIIRYVLQPLEEDEIG